LLIRIFADVQSERHVDLQDIRQFSTLLIGDAAAVAPAAENMASYDAAFANSTCDDMSYSCALTIPVDFVSYSMN
jgi:hypothetical protein